MKRTLPPRQPTYYQLIKRKYQAPTESNFRTRLRRANELLAPCPRPALMQKFFGKGEDTDSPKRGIRGDPTTWIVYSDGSLSAEGAASYGFTIHQKDLSIYNGSGRLRPAEVFDAKATGALKGLKATLNLLGLAARDIIVYLDNLTAAIGLQGTPSNSSQAVFIKFQALVASYRAI
ncbi:reverse transcriptase [Fusarium sp. NRRL 25303]|nr:reverse transcriptase [Fusarium sp. NRRL 25303]